MSNPVVIRYPLDLTGTYPGNFVTGETRGPFQSSGRVFAPLYGPFFAKSLVLRNKVTNDLLVPNVDYRAVVTFIEPTLRSGSLICSVVEIMPVAFGQEVVCEYQALGGDYALSTSALQDLLDSLNNDDRAVQWANIYNKPAEFNPAPHFHMAYDTSEWQYVLAALLAVKEAIVQSSAQNFEELYAYVDVKQGQTLAAIDVVDDSMQAHVIDYNNPHHVTKEQLGLGNVGNYGLSTPEIARLNLSNTTLITPYLMPFANEYHTLNYGNPHHTSKMSVGLGNVDNYVTATIPMALAGTDNQSFLTPFGFASMLAQALEGSNTPTPPTNVPPKASFTLSYILDGVPYGSTTKTYPDVSSVPATSYFDITATDTSTQGSSAITSIRWLITSNNDPSINTSGSSSPMLFSVDLAKPTGGVGSSTVKYRTVTLTVTDANGLINIKTTNLTFKIEIGVSPPINVANGRAPRVNGVVLDVTGTSIEPYENVIYPGAPAYTAEHVFTIDLEPFWIGWPGGGDDLLIKANHTVDWTIELIDNVSTSYSNHSSYDTWFSTSVAGGSPKKYRVTYHITNIVTNLSSSNSFEIHAFTDDTGMLPQAIFHPPLGGNADMTVSAPSNFRIPFKDFSKAVGDNKLTSLMWDIPSGINSPEMLARASIDHSGSDETPGGTIYIDVNSGNIPTYGSLAYGSHDLTVTLIATQGKDKYDNPITPLNSPVTPHTYSLVYRQPVGVSNDWDYKVSFKIDPTAVVITGYNSVIIKITNLTQEGDTAATDVSSWTWEFVGDDGSNPVVLSTVNSKHVPNINKQISDTINHLTVTLTTVSKSGVVGVKVRDVDLGNTDPP